MQGSWDIEESPQRSVIKLTLMGFLRFMLYIDGYSVLAQIIN